MFTSKFYWHDIWSHLLQNKTSKNLPQFGKNSKSRGYNIFLFFFVVVDISVFLDCFMLGLADYVDDFITF